MPAVSTDVRSVRRRPRPIALVERVPVAPDADATLARVCSDLGDRLLDVVVAPAGLDVPVSGVCLHDPGDAAATGWLEGRIVLAIGASGGDHATHELLLEAGAAGACAVVCRARDGVSTDTITAADRAGVALLTARLEIAWDELYELLRTALTITEPQFVRGTGHGLDDLFALADATAAVTGGSVTIEDAGGRMLAYSRAREAEVDQPRMDTILERQVPERWMKELRRHGVIDRLLRSDDAIRVEVPDVQPRKTIAIRAGGQVLGAIWLAGGEALPAVGTDLALREAARLAALQLLRHRVGSDLERRVRGRTLQLLLSGKGVPATSLERLGLPTTGGYVALALAVAPEAAAPRTLQRLVDLVVLHLQAHRRDVAGTVLDGRVLGLVAAAGERERATLVTTLQDCVNRAHGALRADLFVGLGERVDSPDAIVEARASADRCVELGRSPNRVVAYEDIHDDALLEDVRGFMAHHPSPLSRQLRKLRDHDLAHDTSYIPTLRAFLRALGDAGAAAKLLQIHVNTFRYRMRRVVEITELDLSDADTRFALELQLRAMPPA